MTLGVGYFIPAVLPQIGLDPIYFFITVIVLLAWFAIKWDSVKALAAKSNRAEMALGSGLIGADYLFNGLRGSRIGILDLLVIFAGAVIFTYGVGSLKKFSVPMAYGLVLLAGYQIEAYTPNFVALQDWLAGVLAGSVSLLGIGATSSGHFVSMDLANGEPVLMDIAGDCTGVQGILAFGMLSTMTLFDFKPKMSRMIPLFAGGFLGAFLINIVRLLVVFLTFEYLGVAAGTEVHVYFGYLIFIVWVMAFWAVAFKYLAPTRGATPSGVGVVAPLVRKP